MQLIDRIERRRFVGREFLLFLWFESELLDATLRTARHGSFGLWLERSLVLTEGRESTKITAPMPGMGREAKEALLRGQLPESAGVRIAWNDDETALVLKAETLAISGLKLKTVVDKAEPPSDLLRELTGQAGGRPHARSEPADDREAFYERMAMVQELEELLEALYRDFLDVRLSERWQSVVVPALKRWVVGEPVDADAYLEARNPAPQAASEELEQPRAPDRATDSMEVSSAPSAASGPMDSDAAVAQVASEELTPEPAPSLREELRYAQTEWAAAPEG